MALAATLAVMERLGYSLDNLTLMALTVAIGFVVDDAVIMIENIMRHMEAGDDDRCGRHSPVRGRSASPCCRSARR